MVKAVMYKVEVIVAILAAALVPQCVLAANEGLGRLNSEIHWGVIDKLFRTWKI